MTTKLWAILLALFMICLGSSAFSAPSKCLSGLYCPDGMRCVEGGKDSGGTAANCNSGRRTPPAADCAKAETHWKSAEQLNTRAAYEDHLARFGACEFATLATGRIEAMQK